MREDDAEEEVTVGRKMTTAQHISKKIKDNFQGFLFEETDVRLGKNKKTLRTTLTDDYEHNKAKKVPKVVMGPTYYSDLRAEFRSSEDVHAQLKSETEGLTIDPALLKSLRPVTENTVPDRRLFMDYLSVSTRKPNEREFGAVARVFIGLKVGCNLQLRDAMCILRYIERLMLYKAFVL